MRKRRHSLGIIAGLTLCCLSFSLVVLIFGVLSGRLGGGGFGLPHVLAIVVGIGIMLCGRKENKFCQCHK